MAQVDSYILVFVRAKMSFLSVCPLLWLVMGRATRKASGEGQEPCPAWERDWRCCWAKGDVIVDENQRVGQ